MDLWIKHNNILMKELIIIPYAKKMTINTGKRGHEEERMREIDIDIERET